MELKEFIKQTIIQITDGVRESNTYIVKNKAGEGIYGAGNKEINFDIAVSTNEEETSGIGGKISVASIFSAGGSDETKTKASNVSRIQFKILVHIDTYNENIDINSY